MAALARSCLGLIAREAGKRSTAKAVTYAFMHWCVAMTVAYLITGNWRAALAIGLVEPAVQTIAYTLHERVWSRV
ncbi:DUF2061 domain-containing protein [Maricaulis alexandrii]|uniref:DUF2061 domain-containing protein n=1 Tax=Maricaulis alexandrii TaxID=2570354 RepID=UPI001107ADEF|nr:DUF2061 domain-containing protein [Maricaulis alexandrii]